MIKKQMLNKKIYVISVTLGLFLMLGNSSVVAESIVSPSVIISPTITDDISPSTTQTPSPTWSITPTITLTTSPTKTPTPKPTKYPTFAVTSPTPSEALQNEVLGNSQEGSPTETLTPTPVAESDVTDKIPRLAYIFIIGGIIIIATVLFLFLKNKKKYNG